MAPADPGRRGWSTGAVTERADSRAVLVTGSSRGIGRAIAHAFAAGGDRVAVHSGSSRQAEVAAAVLWLASPAARFASGTVIDVNGASHLRS